MEKRPFTTINEERTQKGIFFRFPIQKVSLDEWEGAAWAWYKVAKWNPLHWLINTRILKGYPKWREADNFAGIGPKVFCSPIYFSREFKKATHVFSDEHPTIKKIVVWGYEPYMNSCSGSAKVEYTKIFLKNGEVIKLKVYESFKYIYAHVIEEKFCR